MTAQQMSYYITTGLYGVLYMMGGYMVCKVALWLNAKRGWEKV